MYYPRSFLKFILLGFLLVSLPLLYALGELIYSLDRLATESRQEVLQAAQAGRSSRLLFEQATTLDKGNKSAQAKLKLVRELFTVPPSETPPKPVVPKPAAKPKPKK